MLDFIPEGCLHFLEDVYCIRISRVVFDMSIVFNKSDFAAARCGIERLAKFYEGLSMRTITVATAFKMPLHGISSLLSAFSKPLTEASKQASKQASKPLFIIKACFYPTDVFPAANSPFFLILKVQTFCALKNCINPILQPRSPAMDYRGCFFNKETKQYGQ